MSIWLQNAPVFGELELMKMMMSHLLLIKSLLAIYQMMSLSYLILLINKHTDTPTLVEKSKKKNVDLIILNRQLGQLKYFIPP